MASEISEQIKKYTARLVADTLGGRVVWTRLNPTTFGWDSTDGTQARVTLQEVEVPRVVVGPSGRTVRQVKRYVLQATDLPTRQVRLDLDSRQDEIIHASLAELYRAVSDSISQRGLDYLSSLLPPEN
jgi:hypothetical protein